MSPPATPLSGLPEAGCHPYEQLVSPKRATSAEIGRRIRRPLGSTPASGAIGGSKGGFTMSREKRRKVLGATLVLLGLFAGSGTATAWESPLGWHVPSVEIGRSRQQHKRANPEERHLHPCEHHAPPRASSARPEKKVLASSIFALSGQNLTWRSRAQLPQNTVRLSCSVPSCVRRVPTLLT